MKTKTVCRSCLEKDAELKQARDLLTHAHNEKVRIQNKLSSEVGETQTDLDNAYRPKLKPIKVDENTVTESQCWTYVGLALFAGFFFGLFIMWGGYGG